MYRDINSIPVLAKAGAVIPTTDEIGNADSNPQELCIHVYAGADGSFTLYEDDNVSEDYKTGKCVTTAMNFHWGSNAEFIIEGAQGETELIPEKRTLVIKLHGIKDCTDRISVSADGSALSGSAGCSAAYDDRTRTLTCTLKDVPVCTQIRLIAEHAETAENDFVKECFDFLDQAEISFILKDTLYGMILKSKDRTVLISELQAMDLDADLLGVLTEIICA